MNEHCTFPVGDCPLRTQELQVIPPALTPRQQNVLKFALQRFADEARRRAAAAGQDLEGRFFRAGAFEQFTQDAEDADATLFVISQMGIEPRLVTVLPPLTGLRKLAPLQPGDLEATLGVVRESSMEDRVLAERERCARIADDEARIREAAGQRHVEGSASRDRCFAAARAAANVALGIRGGETVAPIPAAERPLPYPIGTIFSDGYWNMNHMLHRPAEVSKLWAIRGQVDVYAEDQVRALLRHAGAPGATSQAPRWHFARLEPSGTIVATEPDGTQHVVQGDDMNKLSARNLLKAMMRDLTRPAGVDASRGGEHG